MSGNGIASWSWIILRRSWMMGRGSSPVGAVPGRARRREADRDPEIGSRVAFSEDW